MVLRLTLPEIVLRIACDLGLSVRFLRLVLGVFRDVCFLDECGVLNSITGGEQESMKYGLGMVQKVFQGCFLMLVWAMECKC